MKQQPTIQSQGTRKGFLLALSAIVFIPLLILFFVCHTTSKETEAKQTAPQVAETAPSNNLPTVLGTSETNLPTVLTTAVSSKTNRVVVEYTPDPIVK